MTEDEIYCKDKTIECPKCGGDMSLKELLNNGEADTYDYDSVVYPDGFNPFDREKSERIGIPYICHCPNCDERYDVNLVCRVFAVDVFDSNLDVVASFDTECE